MQYKTYPISLLTLLLLASFASFCSVLPTAALPRIAQYFHIGISQTESIMATYLLGYSLGQLLYGPLANRWGRKSALYVGVVIALCGIFLSIIASIFHEFWLLNIARFITALGAASGLVISMILIKDIYDETSARQTFAKVVLAFAFVPFLAILLGGSLTHYFSWQTMNGVMLVYVVLLTVLVSRLQETLAKENRRKLSFATLYTSYLSLLQHGDYLRLALLFALGGTTSYIFNALAPVVAIKTMHISAELYGWLSIIPSLGILLGGWMSSRFAHKISALEMIIYGTSLILIGSVILTVLFQAGMINLISLYSSALIIFCGSSLLTPNASMQALSKTMDHANGASIMNALALGIGGVFVYAAGHFMEHSFFTLPIALFLVGILGMIVLMIHVKKEARVETEASIV